MEKLRGDRASIAKDVEESRSAAVAETYRTEEAEARASEAESRLSQVDAEVARKFYEFKESEECNLLVGKESAAAAVGFVTKFLGEFPQLLDLFNKFKDDWPEEYFEGMSVVIPLIETPDETTEVVDATNEVAKGKVAAAADETIV
ncbi:hypothetical protein LIER_12210 [Lithospermum erythrorhizon]|uniref:Uncharacterized protein n=1 Tax=Lithospermum erythrorhizon TaxID=34254 RepID=A0AAV3PSL6_LITER